MGKWIFRVVILLVIGAGWFVTDWTRASLQQMAEQETYPAAQDAPGQIIAVNGRKMHVLVKGDLNDDPTGAPLVLLHGFSIGAYETWFPWADTLADDRTLIIPDMLNFGHSERVLEPHGDLTHRGQAVLLDGLLEQLGVGQVDLVGRSYGGAVGTQLILDHPGRVRRVAYVGAHVYHDDDYIIQKELSRLPFGIGKAMTWKSIAGGGFAAEKCATTGEQCERQRLLLIKGTVDGLHALNALEQDSRTPQDIGMVTIPALVIWGGDDPIVPLEEGQRLAEALDTEIKIVPGAGHWPYEKDPEAVEGWILDFFAEGAPKEFATDGG